MKPFLGQFIYYAMCLTPEWARRGPKVCIGGMLCSTESKWMSFLWRWALWTQG